MAWKTLVIKTDDVYAESLSDALLEHGALSVEIHDAAAGTDEEQPLYGEPGEPVDQLWQKAVVSALFEQDADLETIAHSAAQMVGLPEIPGYHVNVVEEQDWVRLTQSQPDSIAI